MNISDILSVSSFTWLWVLILLLVCLYYLKTVKPLHHWEQQGLKMAGRLLVLGDVVFGMSLCKDPYPEKLRQIYMDAGELRYIGYYEFLTPVLLIKSPDLIKQIFVKDAAKFGDRRIAFPDNFDEVFSKNLLYLKGQEWKDMRSFWNYVLSATKVAKLYPLMNETAVSFVNNFSGEENEVIEINLKECIRKYICSFASSIYFGVNHDSSTKEAETFYDSARNALSFIEAGQWKIIRYSLTLADTRLAKLCGFQSIMKKGAQSYFVEHVRRGMKREKDENHRDDLIGFVVERQREEISDSSEVYIKKNRSKLTEIEIAAQLCIFLFSSLDGLAATIGYIMYELAVNQDIQKKLRNEFAEICYDGVQPSYEDINNQQYLDMVISETMRKWPAAALVDRVCTVPYTIHPSSPDEQPLHLKVGDTIAASIYGLHHDPKYFPNPTKFDPERFSEENRDKINPSHTNLGALEPKAVMEENYLS
ncbi:hypothetical protein WA026_009796 [Henosepilachna vigintioctopunctata]|uniref:Cytochrome P450 n=1 Tax=Henosepilachna vigintioctopunctata TaxID=420089 RepID=A0AAW1TRS6_9CUCU